MLTLDQRERMRRAYYINHKSIRQLVITAHPHIDMGGEVDFHA